MAAPEDVAAAEGMAAEPSLVQINSKPKSDNENNIRTNEAPSSDNIMPIAEALITQLALVPLRPASKKKRLEVKQLPIVLGRTNLAQWWYQSCDCQHYYCRLHCRPVAQNIGSLSKVMIQIDSAGKVFVVGKNPHLVTITPERKDQILRVNDILSIGRRDREPWMRFQVVRNSSGSTASPSVKSSSQRSKVNSSGEDALQMSSPPKKRRKVLFSAKGKDNSSIDSKNNLNRSGSNISSVNINTERNQIQQGQEQQAQGAAPQASNNGPLASGQENRSALPATRGAQQQNSHPKPAVESSNPAIGNGQNHEQLPEWITTTTSSRKNIRSRSFSSLSGAQQGTTTSKKQQRHEADVARLARAAAASAGKASNATTNNGPSLAAAAAVYSKKHHNANHQESENNNNSAQHKQRKRKRRMPGSSNRDLSTSNNNSMGHGVAGPSRGIRSAEDLFNGSRKHYPQIHLVLEDYEASAKLVGSTHRDVGSHNRTGQGEPRTNRVFISKPGEGPPSREPAAVGPISPKTTESGEEGVPGQLGLLSKNFAAALLGVSAPAPASSNSHIPPVVVEGEEVVVNGDENKDQSQARTATRAVEARRHQALHRSESATCRAVLAQYNAEKEAAARRGRTTQAEGEKTSEQEDGVRKTKKSQNGKT